MKEVAIERDCSGKKLSKMVGVFIDRLEMNALQKPNKSGIPVDCVLCTGQFCNMHDQNKDWKDIFLESKENTSSDVKGWMS